MIKEKKYQRINKNNKKIKENIKYQEVCKSKMKD